MFTTIALQVKEKLGIWMCSATTRMKAVHGWEAFQLCPTILRTVAMKQSRVPNVIAVVINL